MRRAATDAGATDMKPLLIYHHIPKTAGTSLRQVVAANFRPDELLNIDRALRQGGGRLEAETDWERAAARCREVYRSLSAERRGSIRCAIGHAAPYLIPVVEDRPVRALCMLRDPVSLVISQYLFGIWHEDHLHTRDADASVVRAMRERDWSLKDVYRELGDGEAKLSHADAPFLAFFNGQTRHVLLGMSRPSELPLMADDPRLDRYRDEALATLERTYVVGTQDRFSESIRLFSKAMGWRRAFVPRANVNPLRSKAAEIDSETRELIRAYNSIDAELHRRYSQQLAGSRKTGRVRDAHGRAAVWVERRATAIGWRR